MANRLCTICARGGSKGVPGKNSRELLGRPLITYTIEAAKESGIFDFVAVSSDCDEILSIAGAGGVDFVIKRPAALATDSAGKVEAIVHAVKEAERLSGVCFDTTVDLDATAPLRLPGDIVKAVEILEKNQVNSVVSACLARRNPYFNMLELVDGKVSCCKVPDVPLLCRQDAPPCFDMNASIYVWNRNSLLAEPEVFYEDTRILVMPENRSIDIDSPFDWFVVQSIFESKIYEEGVSFDALELTDFSVNRKAGAFVPEAQKAPTLL